MKFNYSVLIQWSKEDNCFVVLLPEFKDVHQPVTHGHSYEEAAKNAHEVLETLIDIYQQDGKALPKCINFQESSKVA